MQVGLEWPAGLTWVSDDSAGAYNAGSKVWNADAIPANGSKTLKVRARVGTASNYTVGGEILFAFNEDPDSTPFNRSSIPAEDDTASVSLNPVDKPANQSPDITSNGGAAAASLSVNEGQTAATTVQASDANGDTITYSISGGADAAKFSINAATGVLVFATASDYEAPQDSDRNNVYTVQVKASDGSLADTQTLTVTVLDVQESAAPQITSDGGGSSAVISMEENLTAVTKVTATDPNGDRLTFSISGGADADLFKITASTGKLSFLVAPDYEKPQDVGKNNIYDVEVMVSDGSLTDKQMISVAITNTADENLPPDIVSNGASCQCCGDGEGKPDRRDNGVGN